MERKPRRSREDLEADREERRMRRIFDAFWLAADEAAALVGWQVLLEQVGEEARREAAEEKKT